MAILLVTKVSGGSKTGHTQRNQQELEWETALFRYGLRRCFRLRLLLRGQLRRFLHYYLPTTLKLLNAYDRMDAAGVSGTNIDGAKGKIEQIMGAICQAFDKQLDALYGAEALDISTDIAVLENLLAQEGLGDNVMGGEG